MRGGTQSRLRRRHCDLSSTLSLAQRQSAVSVEQRKISPTLLPEFETEVNAIPLWPSIHRYQRKSGPYVSGMVLGRPPTAASTAVQNVQLTRLEFMRFVYTRYTRVVFVLLCVLLCIQRLLYFYLRSADTKSATLTRARGDISSSSSSISISSSSRCRNRTHPKFVESVVRRRHLFIGEHPLEDVIHPRTDLFQNDMHLIHDREVRTDVSCTFRPKYF